MVTGTNDPDHGMKVGHRRPRWGGASARTEEERRAIERSRQREAEARARAADEMRDDIFARPEGYGDV